MVHFILLLIATVLILFIIFFVLIPYLKIVSCKREGTTTYFFPIFGYPKYLRQAQKTTNDMMGYAKEVDTKISKVLLTHVIRTHIMVLRDPQYIKEFIQKQNYYEKSAVLKTLKYLIGNGLVSAEGHTWKRHRKVISNVFHFEFIKENMSIIQGTTREFLNKISPNEHRTFPAISKMQEITGEIVGRIFFGEHLSKYTFEGKILTIGLADLVSELALCAKTIFVSLLGPWSLRVPFIPRFRKVLSRITNFRQLCHQIIDDRKVHPQECKDLLASLLETQKLEDPEMRFSDEDIVDEFITFFSAGMDTTGHFIGMALYNLTQYPEYLKELQEERDATYNTEKEITADTLYKMDTLQCFLKETLRFHTPAPFLFGRKATADHELAGFNVKKGTIVFCELLAPAFDKRYEEDPKKFKPTRWKENNSTRDPYAFIPFSAGPRNCIGQHLAMIEAKVILSEFLERFTPELEQDYKYAMTIRFLYEPENDVSLRLNPRSK